MTVGSLLPFDRFVLAMDNWAAEHPDERVFMQTHDGSYTPRHAEHSPVLAPAAFAEMLEAATVIVAHAGMGSFFQARQAGKPLVMFPRQCALREHTTDHQVHTAHWLKDSPGIFVAMNESELPARIEAARGFLPSGAKLPKHAPEGFVRRLRKRILS